MTEDLLGLDGPPPSTLAVVRSMLIDYDAIQPRTLQRTLGPSELGTPCQRQIAARLIGVPRRPETKPNWAPNQGTAVHAFVEQMLRWDNARRAEPRWLVEEQLDIDGEIRGRGDAYDLETDTVIDWKHSGTSTLRAANAKRNDPRDRVKQEYRTQAHLYGYGHARAGRDPKFVRIVFLARAYSFDDSAEWTEPYDERIAIWALTRYYAIRDQVVNRDIEQNPERLAEVSAAPSEKNCMWCNYRRPGVEADGTGCAGNTAEIAAKRAAENDGLL